MLPTIRHRKDEEAAGESEQGYSPRVGAPLHVKRQLAAGSPRGKAHLRETDKPESITADANLAFLLAQPSEPSFEEEKHGGSVTSTPIQKSSPYTKQVSPVRRPRPQYGSEGLRKKRTVGGGGTNIANKKKLMPRSMGKKDGYDHDDDIYHVQLEDQVDDLAAEIERTNMELASWKLRYYVEFFRLNGTKKYTEELQQQIVMRDEEIIGLNAHVDNLVSQNQERADYFAEEMTKQDGVVQLLREHEEKVKNLHENLETFREERTMEADSMKREIEVLNNSLLAEREINELTREDAVKKQEDYDLTQLEALEKYDTMERKLIGEIDALHDDYKEQLKEKGDAHKALEAKLDKMNEENIFLSSKSAAAELAKTEILSKYATAESQREISEADLRAMTSKFERVSSELEKRDRQYGEETMLLQVLKAEADRLKAEYQRKDLVITGMKSELAASQDDYKRLSQELVASRASNQEKADLVVKKDHLLEERERDFKLRVQAMQTEHAASISDMDEKVRAIVSDHERQVMVMEGRISDMEASQTMRFLNYALAEQEKEARIRREEEEKRQRLKAEMEHKLMLEHKERERAEVEIREAAKAASKIQAIIRGNQDRDNNKETLAILKESRQKILHHKKEMRASIFLQKRVRMLLAARHMATLVREVTIRNEAAIKIQAMAMGFILRQQLQARIPMLEQEMDNAQERVASTKIQAAYRRRQGQKAVKRIRDDHLRQQMIEHEMRLRRVKHGASSKIQRMWRKKRAPAYVRDAAEIEAKEMHSAADSRPSSSASSYTDISLKVHVPFIGGKEDSEAPLPTLSPLLASASQTAEQRPQTASESAPLTPHTGTSSARSPVSPKFGERLTADSTHLDSVKNMSDNESRVELLRAQQQINGLQEMITEVSWRYRQAEVTIETLQETATQNEAHINDLVQKLDEKNSYIDMRDEDLRQLREMLEEMTRIGEEVTRQGECSSMHNEELEQQLTEYKDRNFHTLGYSRFLEEQLFDARKLQKQILEGKGGVVGRDGTFEGTDDGEHSISMTVSKNKEGKDRRATMAEGGGYTDSPRTGKKKPSDEMEDFASLFNGGPGDSPSGSDVSNLDSTRPGTSTSGDATSIKAEPTAGGMEEDEHTLVLGNRAKRKGNHKSTSSVNPHRPKGDDDVIKTVTLSDLLGKLTEEDADADRSNRDTDSGNSDSDSDIESDDADDEEAKAEREREQKKIKDALHAITNNKMENTASDLAVEELRKQQRALKEYSYRQEEFDKEMSVHKLVEKLKQKLDQAELVMKQKSEKIEELEYACQALGDSRVQLEEEVTVRFRELLGVREKPDPNAIEKFLSERQARKHKKDKKGKKYDTMAAWMRQEAADALKAGSPFSLLNLLLNEVNKDSYFGGAKDQLHEVVRVSFDAKEHLDDTASQIQAFLDNEVAPSITRKQEARREVQRWLDTYYDLCGREPSWNDKKSSVHFSLIADNYNASQQEVEATISRARGMALMAEQKRYIYEACAHFIFHLTGRRPDPFRFRFVIPDERWSAMEDPCNVGRDGFEDVHEYSCVIISLISPSLGSFLEFNSAQSASAEGNQLFEEAEAEAKIEGASVEVRSPTGSADNHSDSASNHSDGENEDERETHKEAADHHREHPKKKKKKRARKTHK